MEWLSRALKFPTRNPRDGNVQEYLHGAYERLFHGQGSATDAQVVLSDLMAFTKLFEPNDGSMSLEMREGMRIVAHRIHRFANLKEAEITGLNIAARIESLANQRGTP